MWIHAADADAAPFATDVTNGDESVDDGIVSIHVPGHTEGHVVYHVDKYKGMIKDGGGPRGAGGAAGGEGGRGERDIKPAYQDASKLN